MRNKWMQHFRWGGQDTGSELLSVSPLEEGACLSCF